MRGAVCGGGVCLVDGTPVRVGMDVRCIQARRGLPRALLCPTPVGPGKGQVRFGEVLKVAHAPTVLQNEKRNTTKARGCAAIALGERVWLDKGGARGSLGVAVGDLRRSFRPARLGTLAEQANSHYARRPVVVLLNHGVAAHGRVGRTWDPLYTALGLGSNLTLIANKHTLEAAQRKLAHVLQAALPQVPPVWTALMAALTGP